MFYESFMGDEMISEIGEMGGADANIDIAGRKKRFAEHDGKCNRANNDGTSVAKFLPETRWIKEEMS